MYNYEFQRANGSLVDLQKRSRATWRDAEVTLDTRKHGKMVKLVQHLVLLLVATVESIAAVLNHVPVVSSALQLDANCTWFAIKNFAAWCGPTTKDILW